MLCLQNPVDSCLDFCESLLNSARAIHLQDPIRQMLFQAQEVLLELLHEPLLLEFLGAPFSRYPLERYFRRKRQNDSQVRLGEALVRVNSFPKRHALGMLISDRRVIIAVTENNRHIPVLLLQEGSDQANMLLPILDIEIKKLVRACVRISLARQHLSDFFSMLSKRRLPRAQDAEALVL